MKRYLTILAISVFVLVAALPSSVAASGERAGVAPATQPIQFILTGLRCTTNNTVCALPPGNVGTNYGADLAITGGTTSSGLPVFTVVRGKLPPGLFMPATFGCCGNAIGGTPTTTGTFFFTIQVQDTAGDIARQSFEITIHPPLPLVFTFPSSCCPDGTVGVNYLQNFFFSGGVGPFTASISSGALPPGLQLTTSPPVSIMGKPTTPGTFSFTVEITDSTGAAATMPGSITVH
jgi:hypothetical protein